MLQISEYELQFTHYTPQVLTHYSFFSDGYTNKWLEAFWGESGNITVGIAVTVIESYF